MKTVSNYKTVGGSRVNHKRCWKGKWRLENGITSSSLICEGIRTGCII
jgi:hypothetical protein